MEKKQKKTKWKIKTNSNTNLENNTVNFINKKRTSDSNKSLHFLENQNSKRFNDIHLTSKKKNEDKNYIKKEKWI